MEVSLDELVRDSDLVIVVRRISPSSLPTESAPVALFHVIEVLCGVAGGDRIAIGQIDYPHAMGYYEPPEPGMHVSSNYRFYPGRATGSEPEGHIVFLKRAGGMMVYTVCGAEEPIGRRDEIVAAIERARSWPAPADPLLPAAELRCSWWRRLLKRL